MKEEIQGDVRVCECHLVKALSEMSDFPIRFDEDTKAYRLSAHGREWPIPFCMFCGGQLPTDDYSDRPRPDPDEEREATSIMVDVQSWTEMLTLLGEPDEFDLYNSHPRDSESIDLVLNSMHERFPEYWAPDPKGPWKQFARYFTRWPSLNLDIYSYEDGSIEYRIWGRSPNDYKPPKRRNWLGKLLPSYSNRT